MDSEQERECVKSEILDCFKKRNEPMTIHQLSYHLKYQKQYMQDECMPQLPEIKLKSVASKHEMFFIPLQKSQSLATVFDDFDFNEALELENRQKAVERQL